MIHIPLLEAARDRVYLNFVAQEYQKVLADDVSTDTASYLQLDTDSLKAYMVAAMQELSAIVEGLRGENGDLKERLARLEARTA